MREINEVNCLLECKKHCLYTHFIYNYEKGEHELRKSAVLDIKHSSLPDILIIHLPEITFNAFVCNFGGLLGLWLGLSVFAIFSEFRDICIKLFGKRQQIVMYCKNSNYYTKNILNVRRNKLFRRSI